jgi:outer membrane lipoprotein SlyB
MVSDDPHDGEYPMKLLVPFLLCPMALGLAGCATAFTGSPHVEGGRSACEQKCSSQGMEATGMVYMGEYSSACVCQIPGKTASRGSMLVAVAGAIGGGVAGVEMQRQRNAQNNQHAYH